MRFRLTRAIHVIAVITAQGRKYEIDRRKDGNDAREGSKTATILDSLKRPGGARAKELLEATNWQPNSLRGFLSGRRWDWRLHPQRAEERERNYSVKASSGPPF